MRLTSFGFQGGAGGVSPMPVPKIIGIVLKNRIAIVKNVGSAIDARLVIPQAGVAGLDWLLSAPRFPCFTGLGTRGLSRHAPLDGWLHTARVACSLLCCAGPRATVTLAGASRRGFRERDLRSEQRIPGPLRLRVPLRSSPPGHWLLSQGRLKDSDLFLRDCAQTGDARLSIFARSSGASRSDFRTDYLRRS